MDILDKIPANMKIVGLLGVLASLYRKDFSPLIWAFMYYWLASGWLDFQYQQQQKQIELESMPTPEEIQAELLAQQQRQNEARMAVDPRQVTTRREILPTIREKQMNARGFVSHYNSTRDEDEEMMNARKPGRLEKYVSRDW